MPFDRGSFTLAIFELPEELPENLVELFAARHAGPLDAVTDEPQIGWVTGRHLLDTTIDEASAQTGGCYYLTLRQAVRKIPASLLKALCKREEFAYMRAEKMEYLSNKIKRQIREEAMEKYVNKMPPALSGIPMVLEPNSRLLYVGASSRTQLDLFIENFFQTVKQEPLQLTPELILEREFQTTCSDLPELQLGGQPDSELLTGRDFLMYLWYYSETVGKLSLPDYGEFDLMIEAPLLFSGSGDELGSGETVLKKGGSPLRSAEAKAAILVGKKLKKAKLSITRDNQVWSGTFDADQFVFSSFKVPESEEMNDFEQFADRIASLEIFRAAIIGYFRLFAGAMLNGKAQETQKQIREWAEKRDAV